VTISDDHVASGRPGQKDVPLDEIEAEPERHEVAEAASAPLPRPRNTHTIEIERSSERVSAAVAGQITQGSELAGWVLPKSLLAVSAIFQ